MGLLTMAMVLELAIAPQCGGADPAFAKRLDAVAHHESGRDPLAIGTKAGAHRFTTKAEAIAAARALDARGQDFDAGLMQINRRQWARHGLTHETAFDACASLKAGANHLRADFAAAWTYAHRRYNCGGFECGVAYATAIEAKADTPSDAPVVRVRPACPTPDPDGWRVDATPPGCPTQTEETNDE